MTQIYVPLLDEETDVWRPTSAEHIKDAIYRIVEEAPADERWKFFTRTMCACRHQDLSGGRCLVTYENATI